MNLKYSVGTTRLSIFKLLLVPMDNVIGFGEFCFLILLQGILFIIYALRNAKGLVSNILF